ncbi:T3SS effector HopA1 family protein [Mastigocladopsis repens]|uniref:T3SS effector HopA1 family protein n=1 Tax=Mastigocladopsis repens TaxID=221287 RepID=UPI0002D57CF5|nr:T3SS effector HopA1 family protein [Mastigocladopsis repens]
MQLLDSPQNQLPDTATEQLRASLEDIASKVQIQSNFCIRHPDYKPLELPAEALDRFQQVPLELQNKYRSLQLQSFLYGTYYNGSLRPAFTPDANSDGLALHQNLENNTFLGVDVAFYERLHESNSGEGYFDPGWSVLKQESDDSLVVTKNGLTLYIERQRHLHPEAQSAAVGDLVAIKLPRNRVQNGFYMAVGNAGPSRGNPDSHSEIVRIYFNLSSEGAVAVMGSLTRQLNDITLPFTFKALYNPSNYGRYDSAVLYFDKSNYKAVRLVLQTVYAEHQSQFQPEVPLFTKWLAPGLALAEEPNHKFAELESFGMNRCQIVANGLLEAWQQGDDSAKGRMSCILKHFSLLGIELQRPYLNANSEDIYTSLDL